MPVGEQSLLIRYLKLRPIKNISRGGPGSCLGGVDHDFEDGARFKVCNEQVLLT